MRILLIEDEARLADSVARGLRTEAFDLAILDVMLPKRDGWTVLGTLRAEHLHLAPAGARMNHRLPSRLQI